MTHDQDQAQDQAQRQEQGQGEGNRPQQDTGGLERFDVGNQVWETDASREQPGLGERIAEGAVAPPRHDATSSAHADRESGEGQNEAEQAREPAGQRGESSPPPQELGNPGTTGNDLDVVGGQPV